MSEDDAGLLKQQSKQQEMVCGSSKVEDKNIGEAEAVAREALAAKSTAAAASSSPPPRAPPTEVGAVGDGQEQRASPPPPVPSQSQQQQEERQETLPPLNAAAVAAARAPSCSSDLVCCDPAVPAFVENFSRVAARLAAAIDNGPPSSEENGGSHAEALEAHDRLLLSLGGECSAAMQALRDARCAALDAGRVAEVAAGAFVHPGQRLLSWMGGARPSDFLACSRAMLAVWGEALSPEVASALSQLQAAVAEQQQSMTAAFLELSGRLARTAAVARYVRSSCAAKEEEGAPDEGGEGEKEGETSGSGSDSGRADASSAAREAEGADGDGNGPSPRSPSRRRRFRPAEKKAPRAADRLLESPSPAASGIVDDMRALLKHADELRALVAARVSEPPPAGLLSPRQQALFWMCVQDIIDLDARPTPRARPRAAFGGGGGLSVKRPPEGARGR